MTCIVGIKHKNKIYIGADSQGTNGSYDKEFRKDSKVFQNGNFLIGYTSSFRMGQLLRYNFEPPIHPSKMNDYEYMVKYFIPAVRECLKEGGYAEKNKEQESGGTFLVGYKGKLYGIWEDYQVAMLEDDFYSVGCGARTANGALYANKRKKPRERIKEAIEAASYFSAGVGGKILIKEI